MQNLRGQTKIIMGFSEMVYFLCADYASTRGYASKLWLRVLAFELFCVEAGSLNEAICYVLATRLRVATRQT